MIRSTTSSAAIKSLLGTAQQAFRALAPIANQVGIYWREPENYSDWDAIAGGVFEGFVLSAIRSSSSWSDQLPLIGYDIRVEDYCSCSYVAVVLQERVLPFVCFETITDPFDTCLLLDLNGDLKVVRQLKLPFEQCHFVVVGCSRTGGVLIEDVLTW